MKKRVCILVLVFLICTTLSAKDSEWITWGRAGEFTVGLLTSYTFPILSMGTGEGTGATWLLAPLVNYGWEGLMSLQRDKTMDWNGCIVRSVAMAIPLFVFWVPSGYVFADIGDQSGTIYSEIELPRPEKPFVLRNFKEKRCRILMIDTQT